MKTEVPGIEFVRQVGELKEYKLLKNGLTILLASDLESPVAGLMVTYHVGSRHEGIGYTGATHLLEHLMFKGSQKFPREKGADLLEARGAILNATTWMDRTNYYEIVPVTLLPFAAEFEASRMRGAVISEKDRVSEMPIVWNEFERGENHPIEALDKLIWSTAFQAHPYHHSTIGWRSDIENVSIERLQQFYNDFYWPNNATVSIVGGIDEVSALKLIKEHFGEIPHSPNPIPRPYTTEPVQEGERRVIVSRTGPNMVGMGHKIPNAHHPDMAAIGMLGTLLAGHKRSRLYRRFIDTAMATSVSAYGLPLHDPGLFTTYVTLADGVSHADIEKGLKEEFALLAKKGPTKAELAQARRYLRAYTAEKRDGAYAFLSALNEDIATGDWTRFVRFPEAMLRATEADIAKVAKRYLVDDQATVGWFVGKP
ncbi:MAG TPA: pitrilysin family protein [Candidatus Paceibacterota bacterium]|nr:pitrilysin family protein [Candidatus Paceibacterota bacterium]